MNVTVNFLLFKYSFKYGCERWGRANEDYFYVSIVVVVVWFVYWHQTEQQPFRIERTEDEKLCNQIYISI